MPLSLDEDIESFSEYIGTPVTTVCIRVLEQTLYGVPSHHADILKQFKDWHTSGETL